MSKMAVKCVLLLSVVLSTAFASDVPVLIWSPDSPLSDLPQAPAVDSVTQDSFHSRYLTPLLDKETKVIVAFLQDKLHINDISRYADVYSQNSDGGAFKNIKGLLTDNFSLELPRVVGSHLALDMLRQKFPGTVHDVTDASDVTGLDLSGKGKYLVIVRLAPVAGAKNEEAAIAKNDELIGQVSQHLQKKSVRYTALYTAETSEKREKRESVHSRHLMEAPQEATTDGVFFNVTYTNGTLYAYLRSITVCVVYDFKKDKMPEYCATNFTVDEKGLRRSQLTAVDGANRTIGVTLTLSNITANHTNTMFDLTFKMGFQHMFDRWEIKESLLSLNNVSNGQPILTEEVMVTRGYDTVYSLLYSFHCTAMQWYPKNDTKLTQGYISLGGFQIQPYNVTGTGFSLSQDCQGWFTTAIWMSLVPIAIHLVILLFGMYMLASLSTNDRFDDPKGKSLTINAGE